jgi:hypothetical protein
VLDHFCWMKCLISNIGGSYLSRTVQY